MAKDFIPLYVTPESNIWTVNSPEVSFRYNNVIPINTGKEVSISHRPSFEEAGTNTHVSAFNVVGSVFNFSNTAVGGSYVFRSSTSYYYDSGQFSAAVTGGNDMDPSRKAHFINHNEAGNNYVLLHNPGRASLGATTKHGNLYYTNSHTTAPTRITDANAPGNNGISTTSGGASLAGYVFLCDINGKIQNSNLDDMTTWTATDFIVAEKVSDIGCYLGKHKEHIVYIGSESIEFFYLDPSKSVGSPLTKRPDISYSIGCVLPNTVVEKDDVIYFIGTSLQDGHRLYKLDNFQLTDITPISVVEFLRGLSALDNNPSKTVLATTNSSDALINTIYMSKVPKGDGNYGLYLFVDVIDKGLYIDLSIPFVSRWNTDAIPPTTNGGVDWTEVLPIIDGDGPLVMYANGWVGLLTSRANSISDMGSTSATASIYTDVWDAGVNNTKRVHRTTLKNHKRILSSLNPDTVTLSWVDVDKVSTGGFVSSSFTTNRTVNANLANASLVRCGSTRGRMFKVQLNDNGLFYGIELDYDILGH